jgi:hypothetical protein
LSTTTASKPALASKLIDAERVGCTRSSAARRVVEDGRQRAAASTPRVRVRKVRAI